jgi:predicted MFS family arabinose efflux permease
MLSLGMGIRQVFGVFLQPVARDLALTVTDLTLALSVQNLAWGLSQPFAGALAGQFGFRPILLSGALLYAAGLGAMAAAGSLFEIMLGAGVLVGLALACTASAMAQSVAARAASARNRSLILGLITGAGSLGALLAAPLGQATTVSFGWRTGILAILALALLMIPAAWFAGRVDQIPLPRAEAGRTGDVGAAAAVRVALSSPAFLLMTSCYFVCGMQLVFLTTHLPSYLALCGMDPMLSAEALSMIAVANLFGSLFFGRAGGHWPKLVLLGSIYVTRSLVIGWYFLAPPTPTSTLVFAAAAGFLWLGVGPLVAGTVGEMFGLRWQSMIQGLAFMSHQLGSFLGAFGGGLAFDLVGSYDLAWRIGVGLGLAAGVIQIGAALAWPPDGQSGAKVGALTQEAAL